MTNTTVEILKILPCKLTDENFKLTNGDKWAVPLNCRQGVSYKLVPKHPEFKHLFEVFFDNYYTNIDTDFILDVQCSCVVQFDVSTLVPTAEDLYFVYEQANNAMGWKIIEKGAETGIKADLSLQNAPFEGQKEYLNKAIENMLNYD